MQNSPSSSDEPEHVIGEEGKIWPLAPEKAIKEYQAMIHRTVDGSDPLVEEPGP